MESLRWAVCCSKWQPTIHQWSLAGQCVQTEEKLRIGKFFFQRDAKSAMVGRLLLRRSVTEMLDIPYSQIKLGRTEKGKPFVENLPGGFSNFSVNVSHQGDYAVLAADRHCSVGTDVMKIALPRNKSIDDYLCTFRKQFTESEWQSITSASAEWQRLENFYRFWCLKESYVKALGVGIGFSLQRLEFDVASQISTESIINDTRLFVDGHLLSDWRFEETMLDREHCVAVAKQTSTTLPAEKFTILNINHLLERAEPLTPADESFWTNFEAKQQVM